MNIPALIVVVYAVLVVAGGTMGFVRAGSRPSLMGGLFGGFGLFAAAWGISRHQSWGLPLALVLIFGLFVFFSIRYLRSRPRAFMPGGLMSLLSLLALVAVEIAVHRL